MPSGKPRSPHILICLAQFTDFVGGAATYVPVSIHRSLRGKQREGVYKVLLLIDLQTALADLLLKPHF